MENNETNTWLYNYIYIHMYTVYTCTCMYIWIVLSETEPKQYDEDADDCSGLKVNRKHIIRVNPNHHQQLNRKVMQVEWKSHAAGRFWVKDGRHQSNLCLETSIGNLILHPWNIIPDKWQFSDGLAFGVVPTRWFFGLDLSSLASFWTVIYC